MFKKYAINLEQENRSVYLIGFLCLLVYVGSLFFPLMDKDAAHHANIALHMLQYNDYLSLVDRDLDYLDKPHLLFWSSALSFKLFGVNTFAHRLPAILYALITLLSTYRLTLRLTDKSTARLAAIMLATAEGFILSINDARMETPLSAGIMLGMWQLISYVDTRKWSNLIFAALGAAIAFSTKGWVGPGIIFVATFFYILFQKKWDVLTNIRTWVFIPLLFLFISPVIYAYYYQYDLHPHKVIRNMSNISGIKFILWEQNFERFGGDNFNKGGRNSSYFFLYHTFLWAFFPWCLFAYMALVYWIKRMLVDREWKTTINFAALTFGLVLFGISFSKFKMPHYIFMLMPLASIFTAVYVRRLLSKETAAKWFLTIHQIFAVLVLIGTIILNFYFFKPFSFWVWLGGGILIIGLLNLMWQSAADKGLKLVYVSAGFSLLFNFFANYSFFPNLFKYQGGNELVKVMKERNIKVPDEKIFLLDNNAHTFDFYLGYNHHVADITRPELLDSSKYYLISSPMANNLVDKGYRIDTIASHVDYNVSTLKLKFLNPKTRESKLDTLMLARIIK
jgi:4-amino-4-deoxy-L-arabinose transferase-like glycosyltransferase